MSCCCLALGLNWMLGATWLSSPDIGGDQVVWVAGGRPRAAIVLPETASTDETFAANELQDHIKKMSGASLPIVQGRAPQGMAPIRIGLSLSPEAFNKIREHSSDQAAFLISVSPDGATLAGNSPEGTLFATYDILEQLGCRWYLPGDLGTVIPDKKTVTVAVQEQVQAPDFPSRHYIFMSEKMPWYRRMRLGGPKSYSCHGIRLLPPADVEHEPELFALVGGKRRESQLCLSNPEVLKRAVTAALDFFQKHPEARAIGMGPNDGAGYCECDGCRALDSGEWDPYAALPSMTDRYVWFFNQVIEEVRKTYPDKKLAFYIYYNYQLPPKKVKPNRAIVGIFAPITLCRLHGMSNPICPDRSFYRLLMEQWGALLDERHERGYYFDLACPGMPFSKIDAIRDETPIALRYGITAWHVECMPCWASHGPMLYVGARLFWNAHADVDLILDEFYGLFFGPAEQPMREYLRMIEAVYRGTDVHSGGGADMPMIFTKTTMKRGKRLLDDAARRARGREPYAERVRIYRMNYDLLEAFLKMVEERNRFDFADAKAALDRLRSVMDQMIDYRLYVEDPSRVPRDRYDDDLLDARLLYPRVRSYLQRFWAPCTESGYERTVKLGEFVAGAPDVWQFLLDPANVGEQTRWFRDGPVGGDWQRLHTTGASWSAQGLHYYKGEAWYRTDVSVPERFRGRTVRLWFGGVDERARVWLNGQCLGDTEKPNLDLPGAGAAFEPVEFDVTSVVRFGQPNSIAVKVTNRELNENGTGGITAPVMLWSPR